MAFIRSLITSKSYPSGQRRRLGISRGLVEKAAVCGDGRRLERRCLLLSVLCGTRCCSAVRWKGSSADRLIARARLAPL